MYLLVKQAVYDCCYCVYLMVIFVNFPKIQSLLHSKVIIAQKPKFYTNKNSL